MEGQPGNEMFFVHSGLLDVISSHATDAPIQLVDASTSPIGGVVASIGAGCFFGEVACLFRGQRRSCGVQARSVAVLYSLSLDDIKDYIRHEHPAVYDSLLRVAQQRRSRVNALERVSPRGFGGLAAEGLDPEVMFKDGEDQKTELFKEEAKELEQLHKHGAKRRKAVSRRRTSNSSVRGLRKRNSVTGFLKGIRRSSWNTSQNQGAGGVEMTGAMPGDNGAQPRVGRRRSLTR